MSKENKFWLILASVYLSLSLLPILQTGYYTDDVLLYQSTKGNLKYNNINVWELTVSDTKNWMNNGRFAPLFYLQERFMFAYLDHLLLYKGAIWILNICSVLSFCLLLYSLGVKLHFIVLFILLYPAFIQFRVTYHDAFTSFNGQFQIIVILNSLSLFFFNEYLKKGHIINNALSILFFASALLYFEFSLIFYALFAAISFFRKKFLPVLPNTLLLFTYLMLILWLRTELKDTGTQYVGLQSNI